LPQPGRRARVRGREHVDRGAGPRHRRPAGRAGTRGRARRRRARTVRDRGHAARVTHRVGRIRAATVSERGGAAAPDRGDAPPQADRLGLVPLVHMPLADDAEKRSLSSARTVVASSEWSRQLLLDRYALPADRVYAAPPGVDPAPEARGTPAGGALLCVAAVGRHKGYDLLVEALASLVDQEWTCTCVGSLTRDPGFVADLRRQVAAQRLADRVRLVGARTGADLEASYAAADLLVLPSRGETYGM